MRIVHWLFIVSVALFLCGVAFVFAGARMVTHGSQRPAAEARLAPVATVKQIMNGIVGPAANRVFDSVQFIVTAAGTESIAPKNDQEWEALGNDAAALIESGNLILMDGRAVDRGDWTKMSQAMIDAAAVVLRATQEKSADKVFASGDALNMSCDNCHDRYRRGS
jgi:hypothetical protein